MLLSFSSPLKGQDILFTQNNQKYCTNVQFQKNIMILLSLVMFTKCTTKSKQKNCQSMMINGTKKLNFLLWN